MKAAHRAQIPLLHLTEAIWHPLFMSASSIKVLFTESMAPQRKSRVEDLLALFINDCYTWQTWRGRYCQWLLCVSFMNIDNKLWFHSFVVVWCLLPSVGSDMHHQHHQPVCLRVLLAQWLASVFVSSSSPEEQFLAGFLSGLLAGLFLGQWNQTVSLYTDDVWVYILTILMAVSDFGHSSFSCIGVVYIRAGRPCWYVFNIA